MKNTEVKGQRSNEWGGVIYKTLATDKKKRILFKSYRIGTRLVCSSSE